MTKTEKLELLNQVRYGDLDTQEVAYNTLYHTLGKQPDCGCNGWGCFGCCETEAEIRGRQGAFS
jgi:hypothetical protein